jgi:hypothetical protein
MEARRLAGVFARLELEYPAKRATPWVTVPRLVALNTSNTHSDECLGCIVEKLMKLPASPLDSLADDRRQILSRSGGLPLKVLLTVYRWASISTPIPQLSQARTAFFQASARLRLQQLAAETLGTENPRLPESALHAVGQAIRPLRDTRLLVEIKGGGRGVPNVFIPHHIEPTVRVPRGLWQNGWITRLKGVALLLLLNLLARYEDQRVQGRALRGPVGALARHAALIMEDSGNFALPVTSNTARAAVDELREFGVIAVVRTRNGRLTALLDPELRGHPTDWDARHPSYDVR